MLEDVLLDLGLLPELVGIVLEFAREVPKPFSVIYPTPIIFLDDRSEEFASFDPAELFELQGT